jgi:hypothetical protein
MRRDISGIFHNGFDLRAALIRVTVDTVDIVETSATGGLACDLPAFQDGSIHDATS